MRPMYGGPESEMETAREREAGCGLYKPMNKEWHSPENAAVQGLIKDPLWDPCASALVSCSVRHLQLTAQLTAQTGFRENGHWRFTSTCFSLKEFDPLVVLHTTIYIDRYRYRYIDIDI